MMPKIMWPNKTLHHYGGSFFRLPNTAYTAHFVHPNLGYARTSYILGTVIHKFS